MPKSPLDQPSPIDDLEALLHALGLGLRATSGEMERMVAQLDEVKRILADERGTPEERLEWLRQFLRVTEGTTKPDKA